MSVDDGCPCLLCRRIRERNKVFTISPVSIPVGTIQHWTGGTPPPEWLECNGQAVLKSDYPELYKQMGPTWGIAGTEYLKLPDLRGGVMGIDFSGTESPPETFPMSVRTIIKVK